MKRPEGFDRPAAPAPAASARQVATPRRPSRPEPSPKQPSARTPSNPARESRLEQRRQRAELRRAARMRRRTERAELRRFTRRVRHRRIALAAVAGTVLTMVALVLVAVYSPLLALRTITVEGTSRVDAAAVQQALAEQLGTPLALIDESRVTEALSAFPLIRSYVTQLVPPGTMRVIVVERQPIGSVRTASGAFQLVDPAGVVVQESAERIPGVPLIEVPAASGAGFAAVVEVLLAMPPELLAQVDSATASTRDDVALVLTGVGQRVRWGSAEDSAAKAALLAALIAVTNASRAGEFDVSAPSNGVFRPS